MALATTTLSSAVGVNDNSIVVASATSFAAGRLVRVDDEWMKVASNYSSGTTIPVLRGQQGSAVLAHVSSANVVHGLASDFSAAPIQAPVGVTIPAQRARRVTSYSAAGAISLPNAGEDAVAVIIGTSNLAMTLADPTKDLDGCVLTVIANGKAAHTLTLSSGIGNGGSSFDVGTFSSSLQTGCQLMACNGFWVLIGNGIAGATAATAGPLWA
jgi:hypothetical protein